jgi:SAM-dependent methyltransferase
MSYPFEEESFDAVMSIATLHHLPLAPALERFKQLLRPGGVLVVVGLYRLRTPTDFAFGIVGKLVGWWLRLTRHYEEVAPIQDPDETLNEIRRRAATILPGAALERQLLFRYSLIWQKSG